MTTPSPPSRKRVEEHASDVAAILGPVTSTGAESVPIDDAAGRVTAVAVTSPVELPLFRNSQMDGFAARSADLTAGETRLRVVGEIAARPIEPAELVAGTSVRIMTGAVVPPGADIVVPVEESAVEIAPGGGETVVLGAPRSGVMRSPGLFVRERGSDVHAGDELLPAGIRLASRHLAVLAAAGITTVEVRRRARIAIVTTGAELVEPGETPTLGQTFDSNGTALAAAVVAVGAEVVRRARVVDDRNALLALLDELHGDADLILTSGGISMGDHEVVRDVLGPLDGWIGSVAMQPGGPQALGAYRGVPIIAFPGNPVSTQLSFEVFVAPVLRRVAGLPQAARGPAELAVAVQSVPGKRQFLRGRRLDDGRVEPVAGPGSHLVAGLAASDVLLVIPEDVLALEAGDAVEAWTL
ncbi:molybdopterin molybdotransferase MoeA [Plantibacter sp. VKM Ac-2880]|uniref:molybdopterin molybdotransferase MoeA n=1 Tax=Plantibacter sp. VKM Ac-2880 TaxID=2783827 RepID=UPI00188FFA53|nr:gephyrin-like molybdotransferase Glp [Plantibacter sp. VKM Ac-2880]MBF4567408.1 molybdopterin molybdotransferase MoeA [Plantibacter sp. VKM Ac-2880]